MLWIGIIVILLMDKYTHHLKKLKYDQMDIRDGIQSKMWIIGTFENFMHELKDIRSGKTIFCHLRENGFGFEGKWISDPKKADFDWYWDKFWVMW